MVRSKPLVVGPTITRYVNDKLSGSFFQCRERDVLKPRQCVGVDAAHEVDDMQGHWNSSGVWGSDIKGPNGKAQGAGGGFIAGGSPGATGCAAGNHEERE